MPATRGHPGIEQISVSVAEPGIDVEPDGDVRGRGVLADVLGAASPRAASRSSTDDIAGYPASLSLDEVEADHVRRVLLSVEGHMGNAAEVLGIHRNTLARKVREFDIETATATEDE